MLVRCVKGCGGAGGNALNLDSLVRSRVLSHQGPWGERGPGWLGKVYEQAVLPPTDPKNATHRMQSGINVNKALTIN